MMLVDPRAGSGDLLEPLAARLNGQVESCTLDSGDVVWSGVGPGDEDILVGAEIKSLEDMLTSMRSGRYVDQLDRMCAAYKVVYLMIQGVWKPNEEGWIVVPIKGGWTVLNIATREQGLGGRRANFLYSELDKFITSLEMKRDVIVRRVPEFSRSHRLELIHQLVNLHQWWQKPWDSHDSVEKVKLQSGNPIAGKASVLRMVAAQCPGVGWELSRHIDQYFGTVEAFVAADVADLMCVRWKTKGGRKAGISERLAGEIYNAMRGKG